MSISWWSSSVDETAWRWSPGMTLWRLRNVMYGTYGSSGIALLCLRISGLTHLEFGLYVRQQIPPVILKCLGARIRTRNATFHYIHIRLWLWLVMVCHRYQGGYGYFFMVIGQEFECQMFVGQKFVRKLSSMAKDCQQKLQQKRSYANFW